MEIEFKNWKPRTKLIRLIFTRAGKPRQSLQWGVDLISWNHLSLLCTHARGVSAWHKWPLFNFLL
jgi:hypothetical protein